MEKTITSNSILKYYLPKKQVIHRKLNYRLNKINIFKNSKLYLVVNNVCDTISSAD